MQQAGQVAVFAGTDPAHHGEQRLRRGVSGTASVAGVPSQDSRGRTPCVFVAHDHLRGTDRLVWRRATVAADQPFITTRNCYITYSNRARYLAA